MNAFHSADETMPGFSSLLDSLISSSWRGRRLAGTEGAIQRASGYQVLQRLLELSSDTAATGTVRAQGLMALNELDQWLAKQSTNRLDPEWKAHYAQVRHEIALRLADPSFPSPARERPVPPGSPIGN
jgi:hypothetical protein